MAQAFIHHGLVQRRACLTPYFAFLFSSADENATLAYGKDEELIENTTSSLVSNWR